MDKHYPYLDSLSRLGGAGILNVSSLAMVNSFYGHQAGAAYASRARTGAMTPAQKALRQLQDALLGASSDDGRPGRYAALESGIGKASLDSLIEQLKTKGYSDAPDYGTGSRHIVTDIVLQTAKTGTYNHKISESVPTREATRLRLHYYQDSAHEYILLQDASHRSLNGQMRTFTRGLLDDLSRNMTRVGLDYPTFTNNGTRASNVAYRNQDTLIASRTVGEQRFRSLDVNRGSIQIDGKTSSTASRSSALLFERFERMARVKTLQEQADTALKNTDQFTLVVSPSRTTENSTRTRRLTGSIPDFFPGLREGFRFENTNTDFAVAREITADYLRNKVNDSRANPHSPSRRAYANAGINPDIYQDYSQLTRNQPPLNTALPEDDPRSRTAYLQADQPLQFSNFYVLYGDSQRYVADPAYSNLDFKNVDSFVYGTINLFNAPETDSDFVRRYNDYLPKAEVQQGLNPVNNLAHSALEAISANLDVGDIRADAQRQLGMNQLQRSVAHRGDANSLNQMLYGLGDTGIETTASDIITVSTFGVRRDIMLILSPG